MSSNGLSDRIRTVLAPPADRLLAAFFDPASSFAGATFDELPDNDPVQITPSDLVAVTLLDVRFEARAVRELLGGQREALSEALRAVPSDVDLWDAGQAHLDAADRLYWLVYGLPGVRGTKTSKLLARKRPRLVPIVDSVIRKSLELGEHRRDELRAALHDADLRDHIEAIRPPSAGPSVSTLRLLDAAVWMRHSQSKNARAARVEVGMTASRALGHRRLAWTERSSSPVIR
jgi:hypothetical protein